MFNELLRKFFEGFLALPDYQTDYVTTITAVVIVLSLLLAFVSIFVRSSRFSFLLAVVVVTFSIFFATDHFFEKYTESEITINQSTVITEGGESQ